MNNQKHSDTAVGRLLDYFFHLPTMVTIAVVTIALVWQIYDIGLSTGPGFIRLNSNQGNVNLYWHEGCCDLDF
ncbi:MAG: hypothetical protein AAF485_25480 [Chloroflexota bacterium]